MKTLPITTLATSVADYTKAISNERGCWSVAAKKRFRTEWAKQKKIQVAPTLYVETETVDSSVEVELCKKNKKKQAKR